jgi:hypothetical protein
MSFSTCKLRLYQFSTPGEVSTAKRVEVKLFQPHAIVDPVPERVVAEWFQQEWHFWGRWSMVPRWDGLPDYTIGPAAHPSKYVYLLNVHHGDLALTASAKEIGGGYKFGEEGDVYQKPSVVLYSAGLTGYGVIPIRVGLSVRGEERMAGGFMDIDTYHLKKGSVFWATMKDY